MHQLIVFVLIVLWIIGSVGKAMRSFKGGSSGSKPVLPPTVTGAPSRIPRPQAQRPPSGYAGRTPGIRPPEPARAMDTASPRLAEGAEYPSIVADREADRAAEQRFNQQVSDLVRSEPGKRQAPTISPQPAQADPSTDIQKSLSRIGSNRSALVNAVILATVLGSPRCKR
jgi:hypothetical protein